MRRTLAIIAACGGELLFAAFVAALLTASAETAAATQQDRPGARGQRLADGSLFLPKPAQFTLGLRTQRVESATLRRQLRLVGKVIPDPAFHGVVAAPLVGNLELDPASPPTPGLAVRRGQILGWLNVAVPWAEQVRLRNELEQAKQEVVVKNQEVTMLRFQRGGNVELASGSFNIQLLEDELLALRGREQALTAAQTRRFALRAPRAGVIARGGLQAGAALAAGETVFELIDPAHLWLELTSYESRRAGDPRRARAIGPQGEPLALDFIAAGPGRRDASQPWYFQIVPQAGSTALRAGQSLTADVEIGDPLSGVVVAAEALVPDADGRRVIWVQEQAERFVPRPVQAQRLSAERLLLAKTDLVPGERVVTQGAWLLSQFR